MPLKSCGTCAHRAGILCDLDIEDEAACLKNDLSSWMCAACVGTPGWQLEWPCGKCGNDETQPV